MSSARPARPGIGEPAAIPCTISATLSGSPVTRPAIICVAMFPGAMQFTRMPWVTSSAATFFVRPMRAIFAAA
jgi:hypothetical protein